MDKLDVVQWSLAVIIIYMACQGTLRGYNEVQWQASAINAVIQSPAIIKIVDTLTELRSLSAEYDTPIYVSGRSLYVVPDSYLGYRWTPQYQLGIGEITIINR